MSLYERNKAAWEDAFEHRKQCWGDENHLRLLHERLPFLSQDVVDELRRIDFSGKKIAQFCCNNGRELLSIMQLGAAHGVGFDIAENIVAQARDTAQKAGIGCEFVACNILEIDEHYHGQFDFILFTIGAITWFDDLAQLFEKVAKCLAPGGLLFLNDFHPFTNMLALPGDDGFDEAALNRVAHSYFRSEPWIESSGMGYMTPTYDSKVFTSFSHTMSAIVNAVADAGLMVTRLREYDYDVGLTDVYDGKGWPLSFTLVAQKVRAER